MQSELSSIRVHCTLVQLFLLLWIFCYLLYPAWFLPVSNPLRFAFLLALLLYFGINYCLLKTWFGDVQVPVRFFPYQLVVWLYNSLTENRLFAALLAIFFGLHLYPMTGPIAIGGDEAYHAWYVLGLVHRASLLAAGVLGISFLSSLRILLLGLLIALILIDICQRKGMLKFLSQLKHPSLLLNIFTVLLLAIVLMLYFALLRNQPYDNALHRYPPLGKMALLFSYTLFGVNEFAARFPSLIFSFISGVYVFKIINLYYDRERAILGFCLLLLIPGFFYYSHLAYLEMGVIFFICAASFYFLRHLEQKEDKDFLLAMFFLSLGFLYKQYTIALLPLHVVYILVFYFVRGEKVPFGFYLKAAWISVATILPWTIVQGSSGFYPYNLLSLEIATRVLRNMPSQVTYPIFALFIAGLFWGLLRKEKLVIYSAITFATFYILMNFLREERWIVEPRFLTVLFPSMAIVSAIFFGTILQSLLKRFCRHVVSQAHGGMANTNKSNLVEYGGLQTAGYALLILFLLTHVPVNLSQSSAKYGMHYFVELNEVFEFIKEKISAGSRWVSVSVSHSPIGFYKYKYQIDMDILDDPDSQWQLRSRDEFVKWMKERQVGYVVVILPISLERGDVNQLAVSRGIKEFLSWKKSLLVELYYVSSGSGLSLIREFQNKEGKIKIFKRL